RIPAAVCGLVGLKPSRGRIPQDKRTREMPVKIVADGVVTRSVRDTAAFLREAEKGYRNLKLRPVGDVVKPGRKRLKVAMVVDSVSHTTDPECAEVVRRTGELLESMGHHVEEVPPPVPPSFEDDFLAYWGLLSLFLTSTGKKTLSSSFDRSATEAFTQGLARHGKRSLPRMPLAIARLQASQVRSRRFHAAYDLTLTPVLGHPTRELGYLDPTQPFETTMARLLERREGDPLQNATGDPAISLPMGEDSRGLPIGVQLGAVQGREARLLEVAYELEEARPFRRIQDPIPGV
ncbi:MAG: amidase, partial [Myxococcaceae bacterium]